MVKKKNRRLTRSTRQVTKASRKTILEVPGVGEGVGTGDGDGSNVGLGEGLGDGVDEGVGDGSNVDVGEGVTSGVGDGLGSGVGDGVGSNVGVGVGVDTTGSKSESFLCGSGPSRSTKSFKLLFVSHPLPNISSTPPEAMVSAVELSSAFRSILIPAAGTPLLLASLSVAVPIPTLSTISSSPS